MDSVLQDEEADVLYVSQYGAPMSNKAAIEPVTSGPNPTVPVLSAVVVVHCQSEANLDPSESAGPACRSKAAVVVLMDSNKPCGCCCLC